MANFQETVRLNQAFGIVGEVRLDTPHRANPYRLLSGVEANNVIGRFFTVVSEGVAEAGGSGVPAGFLVSPKSYALQGTALEPTLNLPNGTETEILSEGDIIVEITTAADIGDAVYYNNTTGVLETAAPGAGVPANTLPCYAEVVRYEAAQGSQPGLALIHVDKFPPIA